MSGLEIAKFTEYFNIATVCIAAVFAVLGVLSFISQKAGLKTFRTGMFVKAFCLASLAAFAAEFTFFNFQYYLRFFAGPELRVTGVSPDNPNIILTSDENVRGEIKAINNGGWSFLDITFKGLDRNVTSAFIDVAHKDAETAFMGIMWTDEESTRDYEKMLYKYRPFENHTLLQSCGKVSEISILLRGNLPGAPPPDFIAFAVNQPIPFYFSGLRLLAVSLIFFMLITFFHKKLRAKASYYLFEYRFDPANRKQNIVYAVTVALLILFSLVCIYTYRVYDTFIIPNEQYNKHLVDALINGRTWLDYGNPEKLLDAERPHDIRWLLSNGYKENVDYMLDWAWYNGKYYCYYGIVPAVILYLPYKLIIGDYLSHLTGMFIFASIVIILMATLWRFCVKKYMPDARFAFYVLSYLVLFFASGMWGLLSWPTVYTIIQMSALMFVIAGILLLLKSVERGEGINRLQLFFACLGFALAVGCRPTFVLASLIVPIVLWRYRSWKLLLFVMIPYIIVAIPLCVYNYIRFDSITNFGMKYCISVFNMETYQYTNPIGKVIKFFTVLLTYLFLPFKYSLYFPFVDYIQQSTQMFITLGFLLYTEYCGGVVNFPIIFFQFYLFKKVLSKDKLITFHISLAFLIVATLVIIMYSYIHGSIGRYLVDFMFFIILSSLFCAFYWCIDKNSVLQPKIRMKVTYVLLTVSILVGLSLFAIGLGMNSYLDPVLYRYIEYSISILRRV